MGENNEFISRRFEVIRGLGLGGAENLLLSRLSNEKKNLIAENTIYVEVINTFPKQNYLLNRFIDSGIKVRNLHSSRLRSTIELLAFCSTLNERDVIVVHSPFPAIAIKLAKAISKNKAKIVEIAHSVKYSFGTQLISNLLNSNADLCIAVSKEVFDADTTAHFPNKQIILGGVDRIQIRDWISRNKDYANLLRSNLGMPEDGILAVAVGNLYKLKGHSSLILRISELNNPKLHLVIVGDGPEYSHLRNLIDELDLSANVHLVGRHPFGWQWIAISDFLIHPSLHEGLPITLLEAKVIGVPIIASDVGGAAQVLETASFDVLINPQDKDQLLSALKEFSQRSFDFQTNFEGRAGKETYWDISEYVSRFNQSIQTIL